MRPADHDDKVQRRHLQRDAGYLHLPEEEMMEKKMPNPAHAVAIGSAKRWDRIGTRRRPPAASGRHFSSRRRSNTIRTAGGMWFQQSVPKPAVGCEESPVRGSNQRVPAIQTCGRIRKQRRDGRNLRMASWSAPYPASPLAKGTARSQSPPCCSKSRDGSSARAGTDHTVHRRDAAAPSHR
jgi:hypothetical protein